MNRPLDQPPYSLSCEACAEGEEWVCVPAGQPLTGEEDVHRLCAEHAALIDGVPGWRKVWAKPLPGVPLETHELMTVVACHLEGPGTGSPIPKALRQELANVFRDTARKVTLAGMMNGASTGRYVDQRFGPLIRLAELAWALDRERVQLPSTSTSPSGVTGQG